jgi:hypothetical protein
MFLPGKLMLEFPSITRIGLIDNEKNGVQMASFPVIPTIFHVEFKRGSVPTTTTIKKSVELAFGFFL